MNRAVFFLLASCLASLPFAASADNWARFRGPNGSGISSDTKIPLTWSESENLKWKLDLPGPGSSSPIVWGDRLFFSGGDEEGLEVFCYDANTGDLRWQKTVETKAEFPEVSEDTGYAAPTMATDGQRVFAIFATGDLAAFDLDGNVVWQKNLGVPKNPYGMGSSLLSDGVRLFVQYDHEDAQKVIAFDGAGTKQRSRIAVSAGSANASFAAGESASTSLT